MHPYLRCIVVLCSFVNVMYSVPVAIEHWLCVDLPYVPVWPGLSRFKRLSRCPVLISKMSRNFTCPIYELVLFLFRDQSVGKLVYKSSSS